MNMFYVKSYNLYLFVCFVIKKKYFFSIYCNIPIGVLFLKIVYTQMLKAYTCEYIYNM